MEPPNPIEARPEQAPIVEPTPPTNLTPGPEPTQASPKSPKAPWVVAAVASIAAIAGIAFGIYGMMRPAEKPTKDDLKVQIKNTDGTTTTLETDKIEKTDKVTTITVTDSISPSPTEIKDGLSIKELGLTIKNLNNAGTITRYTYQKDGHAPDRPLSSFEILSYKDIPNISTDFIEAISGAIIYEYNPEYFFDPASQCDVDLGQIGQSESSFCIKRRPAEGFYAENQEWNTWGEANIDILMEILSNKENYSYNK